MENSSAQFDAEELQLLAQAEREHDLENPDVIPDEETGAAPAPAPAAPAPAPAQASASEQNTAPTPPAPAPQAPAAPAAQAPAATAPVSAPASAAPAAPAPEPAAHHVHAALRIARQNEQRLRDEVERLKTAAPAAAEAPAVKRPDDQALKDLQDFDPEAAAYVAELERKNRELAARAAAAPPAAPAQPEFTPPVFPAETQMVIDTVPELLAMQMNPDQTAFKVAVKQDAILEMLPAWKGRPEAERYAEAARRAAELVSGSSTTPAPTPPQPGAQPTEAERQRAIELANKAGSGVPMTIGDLQGGSNPANELPDFSKMNDEDVLASLDKFA